MEWWEQAYSGEHLKEYLETRNHFLDNDKTKAEVNTVIDLHGGLPQSVLDIAAGTGRHVLELARRGVPFITAHDYSLDSLHEGRNKANEESLTGQIEFVEGDARSLDKVKRVYELAICMGNSVIGYFTDVDKNQQVFNAVSSKLVSGGHFILDITDPEYVQSSLIGAYQYNGAYVERRWEDGVVYTFEYHGDELFRSTSIRTFRPDEIFQMAANAGLKVIKYIPKAFDYRPLGKPATMSCRNLFIMLKP